MIRPRFQKMNKNIGLKPSVKITSTYGKLKQLDNKWLMIHM